MANYRFLFCKSLAYFHFANYRFIFFKSLSILPFCKLQISILQIVGIFLFCNLQISILQIISIFPFRELQIFVLFRFTNYSKPVVTALYLISVARAQSMFLMASEIKVKASPVSSAILAAPLILSGKSLMICTTFSWLPYSCRTFQSVCRSTVSKALEKSTRII